MDNLQSNRRPTTTNGIMPIPSVSELKPVKNKKLVLAIVVAGILGLVAMGIGIIFLVNALTSGMSTTTDEFFLALKNNDLKTAYSKTAISFQHRVPQDKFDTYLDTRSLKQVISQSWTAKSISGDTGYFAGSIKHDDGSVLGYRLNFVNENESWKIADFIPNYVKENTNSSDSNGVGRAIVQTPEKLVQDTMGLFYDDLIAGDFTNFYNAIDSSWKTEITADDFTKQFLSSYTDDEKEGLQMIIKYPVKITSDLQQTINEADIRTIEFEYQSPEATLTGTLQYKWDDRDGDKLVGLKF